MAVQSRFTLIKQIMFTKKVSVYLLFIYGLKLTVVQTENINYSLVSKFNYILSISEHFYKWNQTKVMLFYLYSADTFSCSVQRFSSLKLVLIYNINSTLTQLYVLGGNKHKTNLQTPCNFVCGWILTQDPSTIR